MRYSNIAGHLIAFITVFLWGLTFTSTKILLEILTPIEILFIRFLTGYIALFIFYPKISKIRNIKEELNFFVAGLLGIHLYLLLENFALEYTLVSNVGLLVSISPFISGILAYFILKDEKLKPAFFAGVLLAFTGTAAIILNGVFILKINIKGDILALLAAVTWAFYSIFVKITSKYNIHPVAAARKIFFYGIISMIPSMILFDFSPDISSLMERKYLVNILFLGVCASALCFVTWNIAVKTLGTVKTSVYIYLIPVITVISSVIILHEQLTIWSIIGIILIISGLIISNK